MINKQEETWVPECACLLFLMYHLKLGWIRMTYKAQSWSDDRLLWSGTETDRLCWCSLTPWSFGVIQIRGGWCGGNLCGVKFSWRKAVEVISPVFLWRSPAHRWVLLPAAVSYIQTIDVDIDVAVLNLSFTSITFPTIDLNVFFLVTSKIAKMMFPTSG